jgi:hypothetical protein
MSIHDNIWL